MKKYSFLLFLFIFLPFSIASAHVTVKPEIAETAAFQTFTVAVPNEKQIATTSIRLVIPDGLKHVSPTVKPGWEISFKKDGEGESALVKEITWAKGSIPADQRDDFSFSAQVPATEQKLIWKAYQTYSDGTVVSWDQEPKATHHDDDSGPELTPYSSTAVVSEISSTTQTSTKKENLSLIVSIAALLLSATVFLKKK